jgi:malonate-semialdehyde dehydrogenase (acetylating)/methylmalonate-semialdehyde dehydrogenase
MIEMVECACAIPTTMQGRVLEDVSRNIDAETIRQPVGVCAAIVPFNFPAMVPFWFLPFAIACGNTFVLKPSEQVPMTQQIAFEELDALGLPPGVVNLVNGGREIVEGTVSGIIGSAFGAAGQRCMAGSVVVTVGEAHDRLMPSLVEATAKLSVGDGVDESIDVGPVVSCAARDRITGWIERAVDEGATLAVDGRAPDANPDGSYVGPTILDDVARDAPIVQEEVFGPVLTVVQAESLDEAIDIVNASRFGNGTSIFTENAASVRRYRHDVEAGMLGVNIGVAAPVAFFPFSGWKDSFLGDLHAHGPDAVEFYTRKKTVTSRFFSSGQGHGTYFVEN